MSFLDAVSQFPCLHSPGAVAVICKGQVRGHTWHNFPQLALLFAVFKECFWMSKKIHTTNRRGFSQEQTGKWKWPSRSQAQWPLLCFKLTNQGHSFQLGSIPSISSCTASSPKEEQCRERQFVSWHLVPLLRGAESSGSKMLAEEIIQKCQRIHRLQLDLVAKHYFLPASCEI